MASLLDRGDSYRVQYLGCAMLTSAATGLGAIQKPLKDLYIKHRLAGKGVRLQPRQLSMTDHGILVTFQSSPKSQPEEIFYSSPSMMFWDAVQFVTVKGRDKKVQCAFEPLDSDHSRRKDKIYTTLDKKQHSLQQMAHPAIFTCVLRRTLGVKALDLHAFVCHSDDEALGLVQAFNMVQSNFASDQVAETGVFGYNPFRESVRVAQAPERMPLSVAADQRNFGSSPSLHLIDKAPQSRLSVAASPSGPSGVPLPGLGRLTQADLHQKSQSRPVDHPLQHSSRSKSYHQLTQEDFSPAGSLERNQEVYEYSEHIISSLERPSSQISPFYQGSRQDPPPNPARETAHRGTTGQGYSLLGTGGTPSGYNAPRSQTEVSRSRRETSPTGYQHTIERTPSRRAPGSDEQSAGITSLRASNSAVRSESVRRPPPALPTSQSHPPSLPRNRDSSPPPPPRPSTSRSIFSDQKESVNRPVAKVPPHKVTGVKVLPSTAQISAKPETKKAEKKETSNERKPRNNWQFNQPSKPAVDEYRTMKPEERAEESNSENLLLSQKKDAEIACLMQNIHLDYEPTTLSPHGTNFESALGYFP